MNPVSIDEFSVGEPRRARPMLVVVGGLPATGKTTVSRAAAARVGAAYLRIDTIEHAITQFAARKKPGEELRHAVTWGLGYDVAYMPWRGICCVRDRMCSPNA
jgi:predicted kinase